jgi:hypothetical protein
VPASHCETFTDPLEGVRAALAADGPGALALLFVLSQRTAILGAIAEAGGIAEG